MGGNAFSATLADTAFPRIPSPIYHALKGQFLDSLLSLYLCVDTPIETPEKLDHGDIDFLVTFPKVVTAELNSVYVPHHLVASALGAAHIISMDGNRISNFAVPVRRGEWGSWALLDLENEYRAVTANGDIFYQVDVHVCTDRDEMDRILFFNAYGDLGMILGLLVRNVGLSLSYKGLAYPDPPHPTLLLSPFFPNILEFMGLSLDRRARGFKTKREAFEWVVTSRFFKPHFFKISGSGIKKVKADRKMYTEFREWYTHNYCADVAVPSAQERVEFVSQIRQEALVRFGKVAEKQMYMQELEARNRLKEGFSGHRVRDWTELGEYWKGVKMIMDSVRLQLGGNEGVLKELEASGGEYRLKMLCIQTRDNLGLVKAD